MKVEDLLPESVDNLPIRQKKPGIIILDYRTGHIYDRLNKITTLGIVEEDSKGLKWRVFEDNEGVFKQRIK